jgi:hypothetical protein
MIYFSRPSRIYALRELSRRAGVASQDLKQWRIEFDSDTLIVKPLPGRLADIRFPLFTREQRQRNCVVRKAWLYDPPTALAGLVPEFIVPFRRPNSISKEPLFIQKGDLRFECTEDLLGSMLLTLSRYEEIDYDNRDEHGRFPAGASIASQHGFLDRPVVDEYGLALEQILRILIPGWYPLRMPLRLKLSHDLDEVGMPFRLRSTIGHLLRRKAPSYAFRDIVSHFTSIEPGYLNLIRRICDLSTENGLQSTLYWKASSPSSFDSGYDISHPKIARLIEWAMGRGIEMGVHPGYNTYLAQEELEREVQRCRNAIKQYFVGGRQHYLRWSPETWLHWERCELAYDSSVGFADGLGFRAGTCIPYLPWLWAEDRPANLLEIPLVAMDVTLMEYMKLAPAEAVRAVRELIRRCAAVGGVFTLLWHNNSLLAPYGRPYAPILSSLRGVENYDWKTDLANLRAELPEKEAIDFNSAGIYR